MDKELIHLVPNKFKSNMTILLLLFPAIVFAVVLTLLITYLPKTVAGTATQEILSQEGGIRWGK